MHTEAFFALPGETLNVPCEMFCNILIKNENNEGSQIPLSFAPDRTRRVTVA